MQAQYGGMPMAARGYGGGCYGDGSDGNMPMGMPTSGFAPPAMPPNYVAGAPQWGMPITGTPIGLPGPPHIPLGVPAGLQTARDEEPHADPDAAAGRQDAHVGQAAPGLELSAAG